MNQLFSFFVVHALLFVPILAVLALLVINAIPFVHRRKVPVLSFVGRYWKLVALNVLFVQAALNDAVFTHLGSLIYVPAVGSTLLTTVLLLRHLFFHQTLDG